jgi:hypothetical protein
MSVGRSLGFSRGSFRNYCYKILSSFVYASWYQNIHNYEQRQKIEWGANVKTTPESPQDDSYSELKLKKLTLEQVKRIDAVLASLGEYGEIHLVVQNGELRYINKVESFKAWKNRPNE